MYFHGYDYKNRKENSGFTAFKLLKYDEEIKTQQKQYYHNNKELIKNRIEKNRDVIVEKRKIKNADPIVKEKTKLYDGKIVHCDICDIDMNHSSLLRHYKRKHI